MIRYLTHRKGRRVPFDALTLVYRLARHRNTSIFLCYFCQRPTRPHSRYGKESKERVDV